jgi:arsenical pump membrane protein
MHTAIAGPVAESIAIALLLASLGFAVLRPRGASEAVVAVPAALAVVAIGIVPWAGAWDVLARFGPTVVFLAGILLFGHLAADAGVFRYLGAAAARASRGRPTRLLTLVVLLAALVTAVLTLDATIVLLTPVILSAATGLGVVPRPHLYATVRLANSASVLLPISNLTNLLAFASSSLTFGRFTALMALPWVFVCVCEWCALRVFFRRDLADADTRTLSRGETRDHDVVLAAASPPRYALTTTGLTVVGFVVMSALHVSPAWAAFAGSAALLAPQWKSRSMSRRTRARRLVHAANLPFCAFVLALAVIVEGVLTHGLAGALGRLIPSGTGLLGLLGMAFLAAAIANLVNNLPATLAMLPLVAPSGPLTLAMLLGVNIGPNLSYAGSLATMLWRRLLPPAHRPRAKRFHTLSVATVPLMLAGATTLLWAALQL